MEVAYVPQTPRASPTTRAHGDEDVDIEEHQAKRARGLDDLAKAKRRWTEKSKACQKVMIPSAQDSKDHSGVCFKISTVELAMRSSTPWTVARTTRTWSNKVTQPICGLMKILCTSKTFQQIFGVMLANEVEISRLLDMKVLIKEELFQSEVRDSLTTKFVHDWRAKDHTLENGYNQKVAST